MPKSFFRIELFISYIDDNYSNDYSDKEKINNIDYENERNLMKHSLEQIETYRIYE